MKRPTGTISATALRERIRRVESEIEAIEQQEQKLASQRAELAIRQDTLTELLQQLKPETGNGKAEKQATSLTRAIVDFVRAGPGVRPVAIVDALVSRVPTTAKNPRKNVHQTILNLKNRGWLEVDGNGGLKATTTAPK